MVPSQAQSPDPQGEGDREGRALDWLALKLSPGLGTRLAARLAVAFGDPRAVFQASPGALEQHGVPPLVARMLASSPAYEEAQRELERSRKEGCEIVVYNDPRYPEILRQIFDPPVLLYCRGNLDRKSVV